MDRLLVPERLLHSQQGVSLTNKQDMVERGLVKLYRFSDYPVPAHRKGVRRFIGRSVRAVSEAPVCTNSVTEENYYFPNRYCHDTLRSII